MKIFWTFVFFCFAATFIKVNAADVACCPTSDNSSVHSNCITVTIDQIFLTKDGMFVHIDRQFIPIYALYSDGVDQYRCDIHDRRHDLITCRWCNFTYDRYQYRSCPNPDCRSKNPVPLH